MGCQAVVRCGEVVRSALKEQGGTGALLSPTCYAIGILSLRILRILSLYVSQFGISQSVLSTVNESISVGQSVSQCVSPPVSELVRQFRLSFTDCPSDRQL